MSEKEPGPRGVHVKQLMPYSPELIQEIAKKHQIRVDIIAEAGEEYEHRGQIETFPRKEVVPEGKVCVGLHTEHPDISQFYKDLEEAAGTAESEKE